MLRVIFDTNVYGRLAEEKEYIEIANKIREDRNFKVYGFQPVRKELREIPKTRKMGKLSRRNLILNLYDRLTEGRYLKDSIQIHHLALKFYKAYREFGGIRNWDKTNISVDFTIVACASFYRLDIVVSNDQRTLLSKPALKAYEHVSTREGVWHPNLWRYSNLRIRYNF